MFPGVKPAPVVCLQMCTLRRCRPPSPSTKRGRWPCRCLRSGGRWWSRPRWMPTRHQVWKTQLQPHSEATLVSSWGGVLRPSCFWAKPPASSSDIRDERLAYVYDGYHSFLKVHWMHPPVDFHPRSARSGMPPRACGEGSHPCLLWHRCQLTRVLMRPLFLWLQGRDPLNEAWFRPTATDWIRGGVYWVRADGANMAPSWCSTNRTILSRGLSSPSAAVTPPSYLPSWHSSSIQPLFFFFSPTQPKLDGDGCDQIHTAIQS